jgi:hypothetical protein
MLTFFVFHRRVWIVTRDRGDHAEILIIGRSKKAKGMLEKYLARIADKLETELGGEIAEKPGEPG